MSLSFGLPQIFCLLILIYYKSWPICQYLHRFILIDPYLQNIPFSHLVPPSIRAGPRTIKVQVGHPIELPCNAHGVPEPSISWVKDGAALLDESDYRISDGSLILSQVGLIDEGTYTCMASNIAGQDETNIQLQVQGQTGFGV